MAVRRSIVTTILLIVPAVAASAGLPEDVSSLASRIDRVTPGLMAKHKTPGVSIAVVRDGNVVWRKCYGVKSAGTKEPVTLDTVFEACSMSKPLFSYAVLKLAEEKKIDLNRPLVEYLDKPYLKDQPLHRKVTAEMVMNHTSGFPNWRKGGLRGGKPLTMRFEPGTKFGYSGEGFWYLQQVVEKITGELLEPWIQQRLMRPLKMSHSSFVWQKRFGTFAAAGHDAEGNLKTNRPLYKRSNAAYTLYTTPRDYARFLIEMMKCDRSAAHSLSRKSIEKMLTPAVKTSKKKVKRGLGWAIFKSGAKSYANHSGSNGTGFRCYCRFDPETGDGFVIMTNGVGGVNVWKGIAAATDDMRD